MSVPTTLDTPAPEGANDTRPAYQRRLIQITLCGVDPGYDEAAFTDLAKRNPDAIIAKVFGEPDLLLLREWPHDGPLVPAVPTEIVRDVHEILCFPHQPSQQGLAALATYPLLCLVFLKIDHRTLQGHGIKAEFHNLRRLKRLLLRRTTGRPPQILSFSTIGWHEAVAIIGTDQFSPVLKAVLDLRAPDTNGSDASNARYPPLVATTITYPCIPYKNGQLMDGDLTDVEVEFKVSCASLVGTEVIDEMRSAFKYSEKNEQSLPFDYRFELGPSDLTVHPDPPARRSSSDYVRRIREFRRSAQDIVNSTVTTISVLNPDIQSTGQVLAVPPAKLTVNLDSHEQNLLATLAVRQPAIFSELQQALRTYNSYAADDRLYDICTDIQPFIREVLLRPFLGSEPRDRPAATAFEDNPQLFARTVELLFFGLHQRSYGTPEYFLKPGTYFPLWSTGVHRSLAAAGFLVRWLLNRVGERWHGFAVCGYVQDFFRYHGGVINIPLSAVLLPSTFFSIFHESGHEYGDIVNITRDHRIVGELDRVARSTVMRRIERFGDLDELVWEVFAEAFSLEFGFGIKQGRFRLAVRNVWSYFQSFDDFSANASRYLLRWLLVSAYHHVLMHGTIRSKKILATLLDELIAVIGSTSSHTEWIRAIDYHARTAIVSTAWHVIGIIPVIRDVLALASHDNGESLGETSSYDDICRGDIPLQLSNPAELIVRLAEDTERPLWKEWMVLAALWHGAVQVGRTTSHE